MVCLWRESNANGLNKQEPKRQLNGYSIPGKTQTTSNMYNTANKANKNKIKKQMRFSF